jgi:hypothetical protein
MPSSDSLRARGNVGELPVWHTNVTVVWVTSDLRELKNAGKAKRREAHLSIFKRKQNKHCEPKECRRRRIEDHGDGQN